MEPLPSGDSILVVGDYYSRHYEVVPNRTKDHFQPRGDIFTTWSTRSLASDNGSQFISAEFAEYMDNQGIRHHRTTAKWSQANREVERQNQALLKRIQMAHAEKKNGRKS